MTFTVRNIGETKWYVKYETENMFPQGVHKGKCEAKLWIPKDEFDGSGPEIGLYPPTLEIELRVPQPEPQPEPQSNVAVDDWRGAMVDDEYRPFSGRRVSATDDDVPF